MEVDGLGGWDRQRSVRMVNTVEADTPCYHQFLVSREFGGAGLISLGLAKWMADQGRRVHTWVPGEGAAARRLEEKGLPWRGLALEAMSRSKLWRGLGGARLLLRLRRERGLAHVHSAPAYRAISWALRHAGIRTVVHVHLEPSPEEMPWALRRPPALVITCAKFLIRVVRETLGDHAPGLPIVSVPNAVDQERFSPGDRPAAKQRIGARPDRPLLLMLANLSPHKGQETAIRAVRLLADRGKDVECWLAGVDRRPGVGSYQSRLEALAQELGVADRVRFLGFRADTPELLRAADFVLLPSTSEGLPLTILEAQATKTVVLAAPTHGIPEVVSDGETGFLIPAGDAAGYAERVGALAGNAGLYGAVADAAYRRVRAEHTWEGYCARIWELYQQVLQGRGRRAARAGESA
jgi:glycosyltransferase involved in cell wall biosynthesis